jgi:hypothetical protein
MVGALNKLPVAASGIIFFGDAATVVRLRSLRTSHSTCAKDRRGIGLGIRHRSWLCRWAALRCRQERAEESRECVPAQRGWAHPVDGA